MGGTCRSVLKTLLCLMLVANHGFLQQTSANYDDYDDYDYYGGSGEEPTPVEIPSVPEMPDVIIAELPIGRPPVGSIPVVKPIPKDDWSSHIHHHVHNHPSTPEKPVIPVVEVLPIYSVGDSDEISVDDSDEISVEVSEEEVLEDINHFFVKKLLNLTQVLQESTAAPSDQNSLIATADTVPEMPSESSEFFETLLLNPSDAEDFALTFASSDSFIQAEVPHFAFCPGHEVALQFRADTPYGLLAFIAMVQDHHLPSTRLHQYLFLRNGHLGVRTVVGGKRHTAYSTTGGLQDNEWHTVRMAVSCEQSTVQFTIDKITETPLAMPVLKKGTVTANHNARLWVGGIPEYGAAKELSLLTVRKFRGCLKKVQVSQLKVQNPSVQPPTADELPSTAVLLKVVRHKHVTSAIICANKCLANNPCPDGAVCHNHYSHATCDCSKLQTKGKLCDKTEDSVISFKGEGYVKHRLYRWRDRVQRQSYRLAFHFKTNVSDSILFFGQSLYPTVQHLSLSLNSQGRLCLGAEGSFASHLKLEVDGHIYSGDCREALQTNSGNDSTGESVLIDQAWHHVTLTYSAHDDEPQFLHLDPNVYLGYTPSLNQACQHYNSSGDSECFKDEASAPGQRYYYDSTQMSCLPMEYSGCGGSDNSFRSEEECLGSCYVPGLASHQPFVGCMKQVFLDGRNLLQELQEGHTGTYYSGHHLKLDTSCQQGSTEHLSLLTARSSAPLPEIPSSSGQTLTLVLQFRIKGAPGNSTGVLAKGKVLMEDTQAHWMVFSDGTHLWFKLDNDLVKLRTDYVIRKDDWNKVSLRVSGSEVSLSLNDMRFSADARVPMTFVSGVQLGADVAGLVSCIKDVSVNGHAIQLRKLLNQDKGVVFDNCKLHGPCSCSHTCHHGGRCSLSATGTAHCDCADTGYHGNRCQFARYPRSCEGYRRHGFNSSGRYLIETESAGSTTVIPIICHFTPEGTVTELEHNTPDNFVVRKKGFKDHKISVNYNDLSASQLTSIVNSSTSCKQDISFECTRARLRLSSETWFSSPQMKLNSFFGTELPGICPCRLREDCNSPKVVCNCDINDGTKRTDSATITDPKQLPVTGLNFIMDQKTVNKKTKGTLTLGNLVCYKEAGVEDSISLLDSVSFLEVPQPEHHIDSISLGFRTSAPSGTVLHKPSFHPLQADYRIILTSANTLQFEYRDGSSHKIVSFHTNYRLNGAAWQHLWIDFNEHQIRVMLNGWHKFVDLKPSDDALDGEIYIGGTPSDLTNTVYDAPITPGLIGCIKDLIINEETRSVRQLIKRSPTQAINIGCQLSCDPNPCHNAAKCVEKPAGDYLCECVNPYAHWGKNCQNSLNYNSVTLLNSDTEMRYSNESHVPGNDFNPLKNDVTFSFRTREVQALVMFVLDHVQNVLQLYLSKPNQFTMIWNTQFTLRTMIIDTGDIKLNEGQEVQVYVNRSRHETTLNLLTQGKPFAVSEKACVHLIEDDEYQQYPYGSVIPHHDLALYKQTDTVPQHRFRVHMGGAESEGVHSKIPGLVGCLSGLKVGSHHLRLDDRSIWTWNRLTYQNGCHSSCTSGAGNGGCQHGGQCLEVFDKGTQMYTQCDCSTTTYIGQHCDEEVAFDFSGKESILFKNEYGVFDDQFSVDLAFALTDYTASEDTLDTLDTETLFILKGTNSSNKGSIEVLAAGLRHGSLLRVVRSSTDLKQVQLFEADITDLNITDGFRYQLRIDANGRIYIKLQMNDIELKIKHQINYAIEDGQEPAAEQSLVVGGTGDYQHFGDKLGRWTNFRGCISNVKFRTKDKKVFRPLEDYDNNVEDFHSYERIGLPNRTSCSKFEVKTSKTVLRNHDAYKQAEQSLVVEEVNEPEREPFQALMRVDTEEEDDGIGMGSMIGFLVVGGVCLAAFVYVCKISGQSKDKQENNATTLGATYQKVDSEVAAKRKNSSSSSSSSDSGRSYEGENKPLVTSAAETNETSEAQETEACVVDPSLSSVQYISEVPVKQEEHETTKAEDVEEQNTEHVEKQNTEDIEEQKTEDVKEQNTEDVEEQNTEDVKEQNVESTAKFIETSTENKEEIQTEVPTECEITVDSPAASHEDDNETPSVVGQNLEVVSANDEDKLRDLANNELEESHTKLSESCEELHATDNVSDNSESTSASSIRTETSPDDLVPVTEAAKKESKKRKKKKTNKSTKEGGDK